MFIKTLVNKLSGSTQDFDQQFLNVLANNMSTLNDIGVDVELQGQELFVVRNDKPFPIPIRGVYFALSAKKDGRDGKGFTSPNGFEFLDVVSLTGTNFDVFSYMPLPVRLFKEKKNSFDYLETVSKRMPK